MSKKMQNLQQALSSASSNKPKAEVSRPASEPAGETDKLVKTARSPSREGKENVSAWLHPDFKKALRLVQVRREEKVYLDDLMAEALNDLFRKYDVPTVTHN
ncbi:MAG TPA: ribbon-helix-helix domain-containing protein [Ktedonobacteraceae bacterium]|nr:ribbon-helix-helix domain-containing protein [Ktedonobacteraceae bacterium]